MFDFTCKVEFFLATLDVPFFILSIDLTEFTFAFSLELANDLPDPVVAEVAAVVVADADEDE